MLGPVLVVGDFAWPQYEPDFVGGLRSSGAEVFELRVAKYFGPGDLLRRAQAKFVHGPGVSLANAALVRACFREHPRFVLAWRTPWLSPLAVHLCQRSGAKVILYNNDDPFGPDRDLRIWRAFRRTISMADACFAYRAVNLGEYAEAGAKRVGMLRSWFNPLLHHPVALTAVERNELEADAVFIGHAEADGRIEMLERIAGSGLKLRLFGTGWETLLAPSSPLRSIGPIRRRRGQDYAKALTAAKIGLVFLSARNRDEYTRRCFEIPATGTFMLAPRTAELRSMFLEEKEAAFFASADELVAQARRYSDDDVARERIAAAGRDRCINDGYDVNSRAAQFMQDLGRMFPATYRGDAPRRSLP